jgi:hypothetical protein
MTDDTGVGPSPPETVALWVKLIATMEPNELADFAARTFHRVFSDSRSVRSLPCRARRTYPTERSTSVCQREAFVAVRCGHSRLSDRPKLEPIDDNGRNDGIVIELVRVDERVRYDEQVRTCTVRERHDAGNASAERGRPGAAEELVAEVVVETAFPVARTAAVQRSADSGVPSYRANVTWPPVDRADVPSPVRVVTDMEELEWSDCTSAVGSQRSKSG